MTQEAKHMRAVLLSAGQGSRLLPLTKNRPKCLIDIAGRSMLGWQVEALRLAGVREIVVVTGFCEDRVRSHLDSLRQPGLSLRSRYNPFYKAADNLASCWVVRDEFDADILLINGDTLFSPRIARSLLREAPDWPLVITVDHKDQYDEDDMKTQLNGEFLVDVGKTLNPAIVNGEAIGMIRMTPEGGRRFAGTLDRQLREPGGHRKWYLSAVSSLAGEKAVKYHSIKGETWGEVDDHADLEIAAAMLSDPSFLDLNNARD